MHADAERLDFLHQSPRAGIVELSRHEARGELDDVSLQAEIVGRLGRFEAQQSAADHHAPLRLRRAINDALEIFDRAIDEYTGQLNAGHGRHERVRTGGQTQRSRS